MEKMSLRTLEVHELEKIEAGSCYHTTAFGVGVCAAALFLPAFVAGCIGVTLYNLANCA